MGYNYDNRSNFPRKNDDGRHNYNGWKDGRGRGRNDHRNNQRDKDQEEEQSYTILYQLKDDWFTIGADKALVEYAELAGKTLAEKRLTTSQIRRIYGEIKRIQMKMEKSWDEGKHSFYLLKPKVAYTYGREKNVGMLIFKKIFDIAYDKVTDAKSYENFCNFMEAVLAYHKAYTKKK